MARKITLIGTCVAVLIILAACVGAGFAETIPAPPPSPNPAQTGGESLFDAIFKPLFKTIVFGGVGLVFLLIGYRVIALATPFDQNKEIAEDDNPAARIVVAGVMIALAIILHAAISKVA